MHPSGTWRLPIPEEDQRTDTPEWRATRRLAISHELSSLFGEVWSEAGETATGGVLSEPGDPEPEDSRDSVPDGFWSPWTHAYVFEDKIRCEGCLLELPVEFEEGLPDWEKGTPQ